MIIVQLLGGLGNQMFQYAAARKIAHDKNTILKLDVSCFKDNKCATERQYELSCFNIIESFASREEVYNLKGTDTNNISGKFFKAINKIKPYHKRSYIKEKHFHFDPEISNVSDDVYMEGYWQSEKYFKEIEDIIRSEFKIKDSPDAKNTKIAEFVTSLYLRSVSIHIRRGDYVTDSDTNSFHGICGLEYYQKAINKLASIIKNPHFFIFSDDPDWVKNNLILEYSATYVTRNLGIKDYEDLRLMSLCKHHIIANSSFSWWGAWLSENSDRTVMAPGKWFNDSSINTNDLIPESWNRI